MSSFSAEFDTRLAAIEARAKAVGSNITQVCKKTGIARATYERWRERAPQTVSKVDELEAEVLRLEAAAQEKAATAA
jgi:precorrin-6x reductase